MESKLHQIFCLVNVETSLRSKRNMRVPRLFPMPVIFPQFFRAGHKYSVTQRLILSGKSCMLEHVLRLIESNWERRNKIQFWEMLIVF